MLARSGLVRLRGGLAQGLRHVSTTIDVSRLVVEPTQAPKAHVAKEKLQFGVTTTDHILNVDWEVDKVRKRDCMLQQGARLGLLMARAGSPPHTHTHAHTRTPCPYSPGRAGTRPQSLPTATFPWTLPAASSTMGWGRLRA